MRITELGRKALAEGLAAPDEALILRIVEKTGDIEQDNCIRMAIEMHNHFGSFEEACAAIDSGDVIFEFIPHQSD